MTDTEKLCAELRKLLAARSGPGKWEVYSGRWQESPGWHLANFGRDHNDNDWHIVLRVPASVGESYPDIDAQMVVMLVNNAEALLDELDRLRADYAHIAQRYNDQCREQSDHCKDCCCARSWAALGVNEYTGKSIPEHIELIKAENERLRGALTAISTGDQEYKFQWIADAALKEQPTDQSLTAPAAGQAVAERLR